MQSIRRPLQRVTSYSVGVYVDISETLKHPNSRREDEFRRRYDKSTMIFNQALHSFPRIAHPSETSSSLERAAIVNQRQESSSRHMEHDYLSKLRGSHHADAGP